METLPHPRDFMGPKWQDRVWSGDIKSGVCKMKCSALRFYASFKCEKVTYLYGWIRLWVFICKTIIPPIIFIKKVSMERLKHVQLIKIKKYYIK